MSSWSYLNESEGTMMPEKTHWKKLTNPNYLGDYSIPEGQDLIARIDYVAKETINDPTGKKKEAVVAHFSDGNKPMVLNKTNLKTMSRIFGTSYIEDWRGRSIQIFFDPNVRFGRDKVGGLRIRSFIPQQQRASLVCSDCGKPIEPAYGKDAAWLSKYTHQKYGKELCAACAEAISAKIQAQQAPDPFAQKEETA